MSNSLSPDLAYIKGLDGGGLIITAPEDTCDFAQRFQPPSKGIDEDPVTGSANCMLVPYWAERLGKRSSVPGKFVNAVVTFIVNQLENE